MFKLKFKQKMKPNFLLCLTLRRKIPVYAKVYFEMTKEGRTLGTPTDGYKLIFDTKANQITSIEYFGRYQINREVD